MKTQPVVFFVEARKGDPQYPRTSGNTENASLSSRIPEKVSRDLFFSGRDYARCTGG